MDYKAVTKDILVQVFPSFIASEYNQKKEEYLFSYEVKITNNSKEDVKLLRRHWIITDSVGKVSEVKGEGVVGKQPIISVGQTHSYNSYSKLQSPFGTMHGHYDLYRLDKKETIEVVIPVFTLETDEVSIN